MRLLKLKAMKRINGLHYAPDGRRLLAVGGAEVRMHDFAVWIDIAEMTETFRVAMHADCYAASPDLTRIAVGDSRPFLERETNIPPVVTFDATDPTWHEDESRWRTVLPGNLIDVDVDGLAFDPNGKRLALSYAILDDRGRYTDFPLVLLALGAGKTFLVSPPTTTDDRVHPVLTFSPDGKRLAATGGIDGDPNVLIVNARTADRVTEFLPPAAQTRHLLYSPDSRTLAVTNGKSVFLHTADSGDAKVSFTHPKQANATAFTPDGRRILSTCHDGWVRIWDASSGQFVTGFDWGIGRTTAVAVSPDGLTAAAAGRKGQIAVFDLG
jgi:WD40 repeat protein